MKRGTMKTRDSGAFGLARRSATVVAMGATLCATAVGCGEGDGDPAVTTDEEALRCQSVPGGIAPGDCPWKTDVWSQLLPASGVDPVHTSSPALCSGSSGWVAISVDNTNHYRAYQFAANNQGQDWITYGTSRTFSSKPACAAREAYSDTRSGFLVAGRLSSNDANNKKIMVSPGIMGALGGPNVHVNPTFESGFVPVDNHTYSVGGLPAMGSYVADDGSGVVLLAFMDDDNVTPRAHVHKLKYTDPNNQWSARITGPALPTGWVAVGAPTIARLGFTFEIVVHARKGTTDALFKTFFYADGVNVNHFSNEIGSPTTSWTLLKSVGTINGDPWITFDPDMPTTTVYFRGGSGGTQIVETELPPPTSSPAFTKPLLPVKPSTGIVFAGSPAATGDRGYDMGQHVVIARSESGHIYQVDSNQETSLKP